MPREQKKKKVFVGMSGGVDSSVAASLLKERGFDVVGVHIKMWSDPSIPCNFKEDRYDAMRSAEKIGVPFQTWDLTKEYRTAVVEYMIREYASGRTPNPDVMCNREIKFGIFLQRALAAGADFVATGHYVRATCDKKHETKIEINGHVACCVSLVAARDTNKDQSYFLWTLTQEQLKYCLFPIGEYVKPAVREMARVRGLPSAEKKDSQGICFIGEIDLPELLKKHIAVSQGPVLTTAGRTVGIHEGLAFYTIGQREGLGTGGGGIPYYVAQKDFSRNALIVSEGPYDENLFSRELGVTGIHWIAGVPPKFPLKCAARIRYRQSLQECSVWSADSDANDIPRSTVHVRFSEPQRAITPGQSVVFYLGDEILGGGIIQ